MSHKTYRTGPPALVLVTYGCEPPRPKVERYQDTAGRWYWRVLAFTNDSPERRES